MVVSEPAGSREVTKSKYMDRPLRWPNKEMPPKGARAIDADKLLFVFRRARPYAIIITTTIMNKAIQTFKKWRGRYRRLRRLLFISPAEARFIELMGGKVIRLQQVRDKHTGFPLAVYWNLGKRLKAEGFRREVRYGLYFVDFANDLNRIIEIDGDPYHMDVVADMDRDIYIREFCWKWNRNREARIMRIQAHRLGLDKQKLQDEVLKFIYG